MPNPVRNAPVFEGYEPLPDGFDEMFQVDGRPRPDVARVIALFDSLGRRDFQHRQRLAESAFRQGGITFSVYSDRRGVEKTFPFDLIPRIVPAADWAVLERGLVQRVQALNAFLEDIYGPQRIVKEGRFPAELLESSSGWRPDLCGVRPPTGVRIHIGGIDLIRDPGGTWRVLEDNVRTPSGVSYVLENRSVLKRIFPRVFNEAGARSVDDYPVRLRDALIAVSPVAPEETRAVVLTPGPFNSAYFEHTFLARRMGFPLVVGQDLFVWNDEVFVRSTRGPLRVHVIYRRIDDDYLDPEEGRSDTLLGVPGLMRAYRAGNVTLANAPGNGVADDKAVYAMVPDIIRFYMSEEPILAQVETWLCGIEEHRKYVLEHLHELVVKEVDGSGGYGMLMGPAASPATRSEFAERIKSDPRAFIAQPLVELSSCPSWSNGTLGPRRVDLRPYVVTGKDTWVLPGGLTRVALVEGSYVVNSSQGGGSKDTWVLEERS